MLAQDIIIKPILTEKSYADIANKKYYFKVAKKATKTQIKKAVEDIFKVKVASVNTMNVYGKIKRQGRTEGLTGNYKKAIVQLSSDSKSIEFFDSLS
jgi:large subunit ribosomal protein L23